MSTSMKHKQSKRLQSAFIPCVVLFLGAALLMGRIAYGYNADATQNITGLATHSSFHYEMVRTLAVLAGFNKDEAEEIGVAGEAVDLGTFTGYALSNGAKTLTVNNTGRFSPNGLLYHFARRSSQYEQVKASGSQSNTCDYFTNGNPKNRYTAPCTTQGPELDQIKNWAFGLEGPKPAANQLPLNKSNKPVQAKTLVALGIYLHSIGDSYSHEKCMIDQAWRFHKPNPFTCNAQWHTDPKGDFGQGLPFTQDAANEVWKALRQYKGLDGSTPPSFIKDFITTTDACARVALAVNTFNSLTQEKTVITCPANSTTSQVAKKRK